VNAASFIIMPNLIFLRLWIMKSMLGGSLFTTAWSILRSQMEEIASRYGG
jgi:hypothetical protein